MKPSKRAKELKEFRKNLKHAIHVNDDLLSESNKTQLDEILTEANDLDYKSEDSELFLIRKPADVKQLLPKITNPTIREYVDILAVALVVAFGIRALFFQPFKIPTSSMQPTMFGIHYIDNKDLDKHSNVPVKLRPFINGDKRIIHTIQKDGMIKMVRTQDGYQTIDYPERMDPYAKTMTITIGGVQYTLPFGIKQVLNFIRINGEKPDSFEQIIKHRFKIGDVLCDGWESTGDHLFVDRFSHYFGGLKRGDIIVFTTDKISKIQAMQNPGYFYIKRLVGLPGDTLELRENHLYIKPEGAPDFRPAEEFSTGMKRIYSKKGGYHGHLNGNFEYLGKSMQKLTIPKGYYFALGDNSANSLDGRDWGLVPRDSIVGRPFNVFWPFSRRWGLADSNEPIDVPTKLESYLPAMGLQ